MSKNEFSIENYENLQIDIKMYMCEISKSKVSDLKDQKKNHFMDTETCLSYT